MTGTFILKSPQVVENCIQTIRSLPSDRLYSVSIQKPSKSAAQRNYWHKLIDLCAEEQGEDPETLKSMLKLRWLPLHEVTVDGKVFLLPPSTEQLTREQYGQLIDRTIMLAGALNVKIPAANYYGAEQ
jgi:hypothetical protein